MLLIILNILAHHFGVYIFFYTTSYLFQYNKKRSAIVARNTLCACFCACFFINGIKIDYFQYSPNILIDTMLGYLISDLLLFYNFRQFNTLENWFHHLITGVLLIYAKYLTDPFWVIQLAGYGEASTFYLCFADTFKHVPPLQKRFPRINIWTRGAFVVTFFCNRICWWSYLILVKKEVSNPTIKMFLCLLLLLQYYWGYLLIRVCMRKLNKA